MSDQTIETTIKVTMALPPEWEVPNAPEYGPLSSFLHRQAGGLAEWRPHCQWWIDDRCLNLSGEVTKVEVDAGEWGCCEVSDEYPRMGLTWRAVEAER